VPVGVDTYASTTEVHDHFRLLHHGIRQGCTSSDASTNSEIFSQIPVQLDGLGMTGRVRKNVAMARGAKDVGYVEK
jgi:hypothetical protein